jgi:lipoprotein-anchoring transpeptidase ErfK/SrfK
MQKFLPKSLCLVAVVYLVSKAIAVPLGTELHGDTFIYNPHTLQWKAINAQGVVVREGRGSAGRGYCPDIHRSCHTPVGTFHVFSKGGADCQSSRYPVGRGGAPMPYCMFFTKNYAIHGSPDVPNYNASHGCIRVRPSDAHWLNYNFIKIGTTVIIRPY